MSEIPYIPRGTSVRAPAEKARAEPPLGDHPSRKLREEGGGYELLRHKIDLISGTFVFGQIPLADPWFLRPIVVWLWRGRRGRGMIWLAADVLLYGFLVLPDGLLNFLFEGCCCLS